MTDSLTNLQRRRVWQRSHGLCEALVEVQASRLDERGLTIPNGTEATSAVWTRCYDRAAELHHLLTRGRGGDVLDQVQEIYHLAHLCVTHHRLAHRQVGDAYEGGLLISGQVNWDSINHRPVYTGPDEYLTLTYPEAS